MEMVCYFIVYELEGMSCMLLMHDINVMKVLDWWVRHV